ncbi:MAG TPA: ATP-binding protein [Ktedonobacteraceae bacterium]|nr:ATP-binding protein [Ktedonobacteraceae bacterium]
MLFDKPLQSLEENDLQMLADNSVREGGEIEYKETLTIHSDEQKQEFLNDVSSFANTRGGYLIYGIRESKEDAGMPAEVCGLKGENPGRGSLIWRILSEQD